MFDGIQAVRPARVGVLHQQLHSNPTMPFSFWFDVVTGPTGVSDKYTSSKDPFFELEIYKSKFMNLNHLENRQLQRSFLFIEQGKLDLIGLHRSLLTFP